MSVVSSALFRPRSPRKKCKHTKNYQGKCNDKDKKIVEHLFGTAGVRCETFRPLRGVNPHFVGFSSWPSSIFVDFVAREADKTVSGAQKPERR
jgi:hypothetical protein